MVIYNIVVNIQSYDPTVCLQYNILNLGCEENIYIKKNILSNNNKSYCRQILITRREKLYLLLEKLILLTETTRGWLNNLL